ncbi:MAG: patatin-like phospholipase family protein [Deltaproteobacteria bacterium]|nr:patatin-like phospholipase family protein [Deltaproteobacteria bacterium]
MRYDLVFEGGAAKGMIFAGAVAELEAAGHSFGRLLGTSAGSITAALLASGAGATGLLNALGEKDGDRSVFEGFMATPAPFTEEEIQRSACGASSHMDRCPSSATRWGPGWMTPSSGR